MGKNLKMENKELQKNAEIQMKKMEEMRRINEGLEKNCSVLEDSLKEQIKQITRLEKEKNTLEDEKRDKLAKYKTNTGTTRSQKDGDIPTKRHTTRMSLRSRSKSRAQKIWG